MDSRRLHRHPGVDGRAGPEGGRLLQRRRNAPAHPCARGGRQGLQAPVDVQRAACPPARCGSRHDPAGRRLDLVRARDRQRGGPMAQRRHAPHARGADAQARPGDDRDQHQPDEHLRAVDRGRCREHVPCESGLSAGLPRDDHSLGARLRRGTPAPAAGQRHPAALHARRRGPARVRRAPDPARHLHRPADDELGGDRRRHGRAEPVQHDGVHPPSP